MKEVAYPVGGGENSYVTEAMKKPMHTKQAILFGPG